MLNISFPQTVIKNTQGFFDRLRTVFGAKLVVLLTSVFLFEEGLIFSLVYLNQLPFYKDVLGISDRQYQTFFIISLSPWTMKAVFGALSDLLPLFGFHKASYMCLTGLLGMGALSALAALQIPAGFVLLAPLLVFVVMIELSVLDLLCEGRYSQVLFEKKVEEGDVITWVWVCRMAGQLAGGAMIGGFVTSFHPQKVYWVCLVCSFPTLFLLLAGFLGEPYVPRWYRALNLEKLRQQRRLFLLALYIGLAALGLIAVNVSERHELTLGYVLVMSGLLMALGFWLLPRPLAQCNLYIFLQEALYFRIMGALDYWFTADATCVPGGPHFDMTFYLTVSQVVSCLSGLVGILIFQNFTQHWTFRFAFIVKIFIFSIGIRVIGSLFDLFIVKRLNLAIGISDRAAFIFGDSIIMDIAFMLAKMPAIMLTARLVHRGYESTIYAILSGFHDMGKGVAMALGTVMMAAFKVDLHSRPCRTENLPMLIAVCHLLFPLLALPFVFVLIPAIRLDDVRAFERYKVDEAYGQVDHAARDAGMVEEVEAQSAPEGEQGVGGSKPGGKARLRGSRSAQ